MLVIQSAQNFRSKRYSNEPACLGERICGDSFVLIMLDAIHESVILHPLNTV